MPTSILKTTRYDSAHYLKTEKDIEAFLDAALNENDPLIMYHAIESIARSLGVKHIARATGIGYQRVCKMLAEDSDGELKSVVKIARSLRASMRE